MEKGYRVLAVDDTEYWSQEIREACGQLWTLYLYDPNEVVHLCELRGSHYLVPVDIVPTGLELDDERRETLEGALADMEPIYIHTAGVDKLSKDCFAFIDVDGNLEDAVEEFHANPVVPDCCL